MATIKPLHDWVVIKQHDYKHKVLYVHGQSTRRGTVIAVGPGKWMRRFIEVEDPINGKRFKTRVGDEYGIRKPMELKPGDVVEYSDYGWEERIVDNEKVIFTRQDSIFGFPDEEDTEGFQGHISAVIP